MDEIQKILIKQGRKDLAQEYYEKISFDLGKGIQDFQKMELDIAKFKKELEKKKDKLKQFAKRLLKEDVSNQLRSELDDIIRRRD